MRSCRPPVRGAAKGVAALQGCGSSVFCEELFGRPIPSGPCPDPGGCGHSEEWAPRRDRRLKNGCQTPRFAVRQVAFRRNRSRAHLTLCFGLVSCRTTDGRHQHLSRVAEAVEWLIDASIMASCSNDRILMFHEISCKNGTSPPPYLLSLPHVPSAWPGEHRRTIRRKQLT